MVRKPRLHVPGGFYHVMLRGNASSVDSRGSCKTEILRWIFRFERAIFG